MPAIARFTVHDTPIIEPLLRSASLAFLGMTGWRRVGRLPDLPKYVLIGVHHTSFWDAIYALAIAFASQLRLHWMAKHTVFRRPFGTVLRWLGGVPIDRRSRHDVVSQCIRQFQTHEQFALGLLPEGTRRRVDAWKSGFYHIAKGANVPILLAFLDYPSKTGGFGPLIDLTDDPQADMARIVDFYSTKRGRHPERTGPMRLAASPREPA